MAEADNNIPILSRLSPPAGAVRPRKRKGRGPGSGIGKTSGKGQKGQNSRSGGGVRIGFEGGQMPLHRRLPKVGFHNPFSKDVVTVNVSGLAVFDAGATVDASALIDKGLIRKRFDSVKVLGAGQLDKALTVKAHAFSKKAKEIIEKAGGTAEVIELKKAQA